MNEHSFAFPYSARTPFRGYQRLSLAAGAIALIILSLIAWQVTRSMEKRRIAERRSEVQLAVLPYANAVSDSLNRRIALLEGLRAFVEAEKDVPEFHKDFQLFATGLHAGTRGVRSFQVLPNGIIRDLYPIEGNEKALGLNLLKDPRADVREDAERAVASRRLTLGGPFELVQGGLAIAARQAVFDGDKFWGLVAIILDVPAIIKDAGLPAQGSRLKIAIRDQKQRVFFGDPAVFEADPVVQAISLPEGMWDIGATPEQGWNKTIAPSLAPDRVAAACFVLLLSALVYFAVDRVLRLSRAVRSGEQEYWLVTENVPALIASVDNTAVYRFCNRAHEEWFGKSAASIAGKSLKQVLGEQAFNEIQTHVDAALAGKRADFEITLPGRGGDLRRLSTTFAPRFDDGKPDGFYVVSVDITERFRAGEERNRFFTLSLDLFCIAGPDGCLKMTNPAWQTVLGYARDQLLSAPFLDFVHQDDRAATERALMRLREGAETVAFENRFRSNGGGYRWVLWSTAFVAGEQLTYAVGHDITNRKQREEALRKSEARLERAQRMAMLGNWEVDLVANEIEWSGEAFRVFGVDRDFKPETETVMAMVHPSDREVVRTALEESIATGKPYQVEHRITRPDGTLRYVRGQAEVVRDDAGKSIRLIGTIQDITEYKALEEQFRQSQKMESVGRLAGGVAHDFNNLLTVINGYSELMFQRLDVRDPLYTYLQEIRAAGDRASALTQQLLAFSRRQVLQAHVLDLNAVVSELDGMVRRLIGEDVELAMSLDNSLAPVTADSGQIHQVLMNLVVNARDAMPNGGKLTISTSNVQIDGSFPLRGEKVLPGKYVLLTVGDTGMGIDQETQNRIFEPFFTTKSKGAGTGLGLSTVYGIVTQSGGQIQVESRVGAGTTFKIYLPATTAEQPAAAEKTSPEQRAKRGTETVLVVEDQSEVRALASNILRLHGYRVVEASNAAEAIAISERHSGVIHLLLTDVIMPGLNGAELAERLKPLRPAMKVVFMSGYTDDAIIKKGTLDPGTAYIQKPFTPASLAAQVREALGPVHSDPIILVVDDDEGVRRMLRQILTGEGFRVVEAGDGKEALQRVREASPAIVLMDLVMPGQEGLESIGILHAERPDLRIIAMSGAFGGEYLKTARMLGARAALPKPISPEELVSTVRRVLEET